MQVYIVLDLSRVNPVLGCYSCGVDAAEHCKRATGAFTYVCALNASLDSNSPKQSSAAPAS